jgi:hypothetical protein
VKTSNMAVAGRAAQAEALQRRSARDATTEHGEATAIGNGGWPWRLGGSTCGGWHAGRRGRSGRQAAFAFSSVPCRFRRCAVFQYWPAGRRAAAALGAGGRARPRRAAGRRCWRRWVRAEERRLADGARSGRAEAAQRQRRGSCTRVWRRAAQMGANGHCAGRI